VSGTPGLTPEDIERGYDNRAAVADHPRWLAHYPVASAAARAALSPKQGLRYGRGANEALDLFLPASRPRGTFVFLHGGYWRAFDKSDFSFVATPFVAQGLAVVLANYTLCPEATIATIVGECRRSIAWLVREGANHGANAERIVVGGHSAGGHLAAMLLTTDWSEWGLARDPICAAVSVSGVHDLTPLIHHSYNADLRLDAAEAARQSPALLEPRSRAPLLLAAGADETSEFVRQTRLMWDAWPSNRPIGAGAPMLIRHRNHFDVVVDYADGASDLTRATLALF
jgi:arylformamidase